MIDNEFDVINDETDALNKDDIFVDGDDIVYKTGDVAKQLGISGDMVRYYTNEFMEYLDGITKTKEGKGGHIKYKSKDIDVLRTVLLLRDQGKNTAEIKALLNTPGVKIIANTPSGKENEKAFAALLIQNNEYIIKAFEKLIEHQQIKYLEDKDQSYQKLNETLDAMQKEISELKEINKQKNELIDHLIEERDKKKGFWRIFNKK